MPDPQQSSLVVMENCNRAWPTGLYQLNFLQDNVEYGIEETAELEFYFRGTLVNRGFFLSAGLKPLLDFLSDLHSETLELDRLQKVTKISCL